MKASVSSFTRYVKISTLLRILSGPVIFISPVFASIVNYLLDGFDGELFKRSGYARPKYSVYDKILDYYWYIWIILYIFAMNVPAKYLFLTLFLFRSIGQMLFVLTNNGVLLLLFPNIFEKVFLYYLIAELIHEEQLLMSQPYLQIAVCVIAILSIALEYELHIKKINLSSLYLKKTTYWPMQTVNPYKVLVVFMLVFSFGVLLNQFVSNKTTESYSTQAAKALKNGKILVYESSGKITGLLFERDLHFVSIVLFSGDKFQAPLCTANNVPVSKIGYPQSSTGYAYTFIYTDPCIRSLQDGVYSLLVIPADKNQQGNLIDFAIVNGLLKQ